MSSDPIEVLREAVTALKTMHSPFDHDYIKDEKCCNRCRLLARSESALASLSGPKGDLTVEELAELLGGIIYTNGQGEHCIGMQSDADVTREVEQAVAALNVRMVAPKPESAEAVGVLGYSHPMMGSGFMHAFTCKERLPEGTKVYTAPPRPEASAPVGVEVVLAKLREGLGADGTLYQQAEVMIRALAQQPAAVDGPYQMVDDVVTVNGIALDEVVKLGARYAGQIEKRGPRAAQVFEALVMIGRHALAGQQPAAVASVGVEGLRASLSKLVDDWEAMGDDLMTVCAGHVRDLLAQQPAAYPRSTHHVHRSTESLPCYCPAKDDHPIGSEQPAAVDEALDRLRREGYPRLWQADLVGGQISVVRMREILTAALAGYRKEDQGNE